MGRDDGTFCDLGVTVVSTNLVSSLDIAEPDPGIFEADNDVETLIDFNTDADIPIIFGTTTLTATLQSGADCDDNTSRIAVIAAVEVQGDNAVTGGVVGAG